MAQGIPRPLAELPGRALAEAVGVLFDVDDTVTRRGKLERVAFDAMWRLHEAGLRLVAVTGRPLGWCDVLATTWPIDLAVGENGAGWCVQDGTTGRRAYFHAPHERDEQEATLRRIERRVALELPQIGTAVEHGARVCELAFDLRSPEPPSPSARERLRRIIESEGARFVASTIHAHAIPGQWDKASGAARAIETELGFDVAGPARDRWLFVGDSGNDAPAFAHFPWSVAVRNVEAYLSTLPVHPAYWTEADHGRGFAELATAVLDARRSPRDT
jgi:hypothetical protein